MKNQSYTTSDLIDQLTAPKCKKRFLDLLNSFVLFIINFQLSQEELEINKRSKLLGLSPRRLGIRVGELYQLLEVILEKGIQV